MYTGLNNLGLNGRSGLGAPSLNLNFLNGTTDSRITYSGGANGTRVNSAGLVVAATTPRFDYNPVTLAPLGLLVEEARTNLLQRSAEIDNAYWFKDNSTITANALTAPDGTVAADKLLETTANTTHGIAIAATVTITAGGVYTATCYYKAAERSFVRLQFNNAAFSNGVQAEYDLSLGTVAGSRTFGTATLGTVSITAAGDGWYRCSISGIVDAGSTTAYVCSYLGASAVVFSYIGVATNGAYAWGAQLEAGSFPTSYIPTTSASVTRSADSAVMTGTNFSSWYNQTQGTFVVESDQISPGQAGAQYCAVEAGDGTNNNLIQLATQFGATNFQGLVNMGGVSQVVFISAATTALTKRAIAYQANDFAQCIGGGTVSTDASGTVPAVTSLAIGSRPAGVGYLNGHIRRLAYYPQRLGNTVLQSLTT